MIAVCLPWPIWPSNTTVELSDKPKWIIFNNSINLLVKAGCNLGNSLFLQGINALVNKDCKPFKLFFSINLKGIFNLGSFILICFSLFEENKYSYNLSFDLLPKFSSSFFCSIIDLQVIYYIICLFI